MLKLRLLSKFYSFSASKQIVVNNFFQDTCIKKYIAHNEKDIQKLLSENIIHRNAWRQLQYKKRQQIMTNYYNQLSLKETYQKIANILSQCTGKQIQQCNNQARVALKIFKYNLTYPFIKKRIFQENKQYSDYYQFQPFQNLLSIFDHRHPILSTIKYLGLALHSCNPLLLRPSHNILPVIQIFSNIWNSHCQIPMIKIIYDSHLDPKHDESPVKKILQSSDGFISFDGRIKDGFDFHFYMNKNSLTMRQNEFLLTSSDSAYIMKNLQKQSLQKSAKIIARGAFSNCGHNFNSIKRIYIDKQIGQIFLNYFIQQSKRYKINSIQQITNINNSLLSPYILQNQYKQSIQKIKLINQQYKTQFKLLINNQYSNIKIKQKNINFINPIIYHVINQFPNFNYQNQQLMMPISFISFVDSTSDAIQKINSSIYGTTTSIFTSNYQIQTIKAIGKKLDVGTINVNTWEITDGITYSGRKRSGKGFSFSPLSFNNIVRTKSVSYA